MGDTGSERSKPPSIPPRCPCGFWGSSKTMNLCSKCFADIQKKQPDEDCTPEPAPGTGGSQSAVFCSETSSSSSQSLTSVPSSSEEPSPEALGLAPPPAQEGISSTDTACGTLSTPTKRTFDSASGSESEASPQKRTRPDDEEPRAEPKQKSRRRCHRCQSKLELVQQELGSCRCGQSQGEPLALAQTPKSVTRVALLEGSVTALFPPPAGHVFCMLHRLPEQHDCLFDHLGRGRQEAVLKMVKLDRKVGRSCQRIGEECS
uniref:Zinc finger, AN1-type domain 3 n=1 Tax=Paramormyrops kingsleyae TaxID=1676925 RepID=A0A3B3QP28_9TELE